MHIDTEVQSLLQTTRVGMLATLGETLPLASAVPFVALDGWTDLLLHLSTLAAHTQNLLRDPRMSILLMEPDDAQKNPLALRRLSLQGAACRLNPNSPTYAALARRYLDRFPDAHITMTLADFQLWQLQLHAAQFIAGFGQAYMAERAHPLVWQHQGRRESKP